MKKKIYQLAGAILFLTAFSAQTAKAQINSFQNFDGKNTMPSKYACGGNSRSNLKTDGLYSTSGTNYIQLYSSGTSDPSTLTYTNASDYQVAPIYVSFDYKYVNETSSDATCKVEYSADNGNTWTLANTLTMNKNTSSTTAINYKTTFSPPSSVLAGSPITVKLTFKLKDSSGAYMYIDNLSINQNGFLATSNITKSRNNVFPNPTTGILNIQSDSDNQVSIYSVNGGLVKSQSIQKGTSTVNINSNPGIYIVKIGSETFKIIKK